MPDREKVIERLTGLKELLKFQKDILGYGSFIEDINDALALLKEHDAVEPKWASGIKGGADALCGSCMAWISDHSWGYCPRCGRAVKWE